MPNGVGGRSHFGRADEVSAGSRQNLNGNHEVLTNIPLRSSPRLWSAAPYLCVAGFYRVTGRFEQDIAADCANRSASTMSLSWLSHFLLSALQKRFTTRLRKMIGLGTEIKDVNLLVLLLFF